MEVRFWIPTDKPIQFGYTDEQANNVGVSCLDKLGFPLIQEKTLTMPRNTNFELPMFLHGFALPELHQLASVPGRRKRGCSQMRCVFEGFPNGYFGCRVPLRCTTCKSRFIVTAPSTTTL